MDFKAFESRIQQHQIHTIQKQYNQDNAQRIQKQNNQKEEQIKKLAQRFQIDQALPTDIIGGAEKQEMVVSLIPQKLTARLVLYSNFPESKPRLYMQNKYTHTYIDENTWEIIYISFHKWNENSSTLLELVQAIANRFANSFPKEDPILSEMNQYKNFCYEQSEYTKLFQGDLYKFFPQHRPEQWGGLCNYNLDEFIMKTQEYKTLVEFVLQMMQANEIYSQTMITKYNEILEKRQKIEQLAQLCDCKKGQLLQKYEQCQLIRERFDKSNILAFLEQELKTIEEISEKMENQNLDQDYQDHQDFQSQINAYQTYRKKYHILQLKKQKLEEII